jgi:DNA-binding transcriptional ArsR family regulator
MTMTAAVSASQFDLSNVQQLVGQARKASELLKALSHETRLLIVCLLSTGEKSVSELERLLEMPQASVSQQLARLRLDRIVTARRDGRTIYYSITDSGVSAVVCALHDLFCPGEQ